MFDKTIEFPSLDVFVSNLKKCRKLKNTKCSKLMHMQACKNGLDIHATVGNLLVQILAKCGCIHDAVQVMMKLPYQNEHSWTALIYGFVDKDQAEHAFYLYHTMQANNVDPSIYTFMALLKACVKENDVGRGDKIHAELMHLKLRDIYIENALIDMYGKCGLVSKAREVFDRLPVRDVVSWTALISGYAEYGPGTEALNCFQEMQEEGISPNDQTVVCVLKACGKIKAIGKGREIGRELTSERLQGNVLLGNTLVDMYAKCGALLEAQGAFDKLAVQNVVSWNILIRGYAEHGFIPEALKRFEEMRLYGVSPDTTSWTSVIASYAEHGLAHEALKLFEDMELQGIHPDVVVYASVMKACGDVGAMDKGQKFNVVLLYRGYDIDLFVGNSLVEMYAKGSFLLEAQTVFNKMSVRDIYAWNSMINAYAMNHEGILAVQCFEAMEKDGVKPDRVTFTCLLSACSHANMATESWKYLYLMEGKYSILPNIGHYTSIVDLLARSGCVYEAERFLVKNVPQPLYDEGLWASLLTACKAYGEVEVGKRCFEQLVHLNPKVAPPCVLLSNLYANAGSRQ